MALHPRAARRSTSLKLEGDEKVGVDDHPPRPRGAAPPDRRQRRCLEGSIVVDKVKEQRRPTFGYNAATDTYEDLVKAGVIDPTKVVRTALQNAASIAGSCSPPRP